MLGPASNVCMHLNHSLHAFAVRAEYAFMQQHICATFANVTKRQTVGCSNLGAAAALNDSVIVTSVQLASVTPRGD